MSLRNVLFGTYYNQVPLAPTITSVIPDYTSNGTSVIINYSSASLPAGAPPINAYTAYSLQNPTLKGTQTNLTNNSIKITGLTITNSYTFAVYANNLIGNGIASSPSNAFAPYPIGSQIFTSNGSFTVPPFVTAIHILCVGTGGSGGAKIGSGGGGGGIAYYSNANVTPGQIFTVLVPEPGTGVALGGSVGMYLNSNPSQFTIQAGAGMYGTGGAYGTGGGGGGAAGYLGNGGTGGSSSVSNYGGGTGGTGGGNIYGTIPTNYKGGNGGIGSSTVSTGLAAPAITAGSGAGAGGSPGSGMNSGTPGARGGGGIGLYGLSSVDVNGNPTTPGAAYNGSSFTASPFTTNGGSGGNDGAISTGGSYGGGGGGDNTVLGNSGSPGAVRIVWGIGRRWPSTYVGVGYS